MGIDETVWTAARPASLRMAMRYVREIAEALHDAD